MKIYSISKLLMLPAFIAIAYIMTVHFGNYSKYSVFIIIPVIYLVAIFIFQGQIDYWWLKNHPIQLDPKIKSWLEGNLEYFNLYSDDDKEKFGHRLGLYVDSREFKIIGMKEQGEVPYDIKHILASQAVRLGFGTDDVLIGDFDRIYLYKHPFPSPQYQYLHTVETNIEDGLIILTTEYALPGIAQEKVYFNITLYAFAEAWAKLHHFTIGKEEDWKKIEEITGFQKDRILKIIGHPEVNMTALIITTYFTHGPDFKLHFPNYTNTLNNKMLYPSQYVKSII